MTPRPFLVVRCLSATFASSAEVRRGSAAKAATDLDEPLSEGTRCPLARICLSQREQRQRELSSEGGSKPAKLSSKTLGINSLNRVTVFDLPCRLAYDQLVRTSAFLSLGDPL